MKTENSYPLINPRGEIELSPIYDSETNLPEGGEKIAI